MVTFLVSAWFAVALPAQEFGSVDNLRTLDHYAGEWDSEMTIHKMDPEGSDQQFTGSVTASWILNGKFLDQTGTYQIGDSGIVIKTLMTFDENQSQFRYWYFMDNGETTHSTGQWDETTQVMTSVMDSGNSGDVTTITADFSKPGVESWIIETKNAEGRLIGRLTGTNTRK